MGSSKKRKTLSPYHFTVLSSFLLTPTLPLSLNPSLFLISHTHDHEGAFGPSRSRCVALYAQSVGGQLALSLRSISVSSSSTLISRFLTLFFHVYSRRLHLGFLPCYFVVLGFSFSGVFMNLCVDLVILCFWVFPNFFVFGT